MKKIYSNQLFLASICIVVLIGLMSNSSGRANVFGQAVTGAPGDSNRTCGSSGCHDSNNFSPNGILTVFDADGNEVNAFSPGETYDIVLTVESTGSPSVYGFQMVALNEDDSPATNWENIGSNTQIVQLGDRNYIEHESPSTSNEFATQWVAPETGLGDVTFYYSVNAANNNGGRTGDTGTNSSFVLSESTTSSIDLEKESISIYPNPASEFISISGNSLEYEYSIYNIQGRLVSQSILKENSNVDISNFESGLYFINIQNESKVTTKKFIKN